MDTNTQLQRFHNVQLAKPSRHFKAYFSSNALKPDEASAATCAKHHNNATHCLNIKHGMLPSCFIPVETSSDTGLVMRNGSSMCLITDGGTATRPIGLPDIKQKSMISPQTYNPVSTSALRPLKMLPCCYHNVRRDTYPSSSQSRMHADSWHGHSRPPKTMYATPELHLASERISTPSPQTPLQPNDYKDSQKKQPKNSTRKTRMYPLPPNRVASSHSGPRPCAATGRLTCSSHDAVCHTTSAHSTIQWCSTGYSALPHLCHKSQNRYVAMSHPA